MNHQTRFLTEQAFSDLIEYVESQRGSGTVFKMYSSHLISLGVDETVHTTRLRHKVTAAVTYLIEVKGLSNCTDLAFDEDISLALQELSDSWDSEAMVLVKAAKILRQQY